MTNKADQGLIKVTCGIPQGPVSGPKLFIIKNENFPNNQHDMWLTIRNYFATIPLMDQNKEKASFSARKPMHHIN